MAIRNLLITILFSFVFPFISSAQSNYTLINDAIQYNGCHCYQLTADVGNEGGGVYQNNTINLNNSFDYKFSVYLGCNGSSGADGMTFILTNNITQIGAQGGGLGYSGLAGNSLAIEYDTYQNSWDPPYNHMALEYDGQVQHPVGTLVGPVPALTSSNNIDDCNWHTTEIIWNANTHTYTAYFDGVLRITYTNDIINTYFGGNPIVNWGWSGSTGGSENQQIFCINSISSWVAGNNYQSCDLTLQFNDISTSNVGSIQSWAWNFGDPASGASNISSLQNPTHTFSGTGIFNVSLIITDISGCADTFVHTVTINPPIALTPTITDPLCNGASNGNIDLTASGGFGVSAGYGGYAYTWSNGVVYNDEVGVTAGTYNVTVTDGICTSTASYTLSQPSALSATTSATDASCGSSNGSVTIAISGGTPPYHNVTWDGIPGYTLTGLAPGTYVANFTDANGCSALTTYRATVGSLPCGYTLSTSSTNVSCFGGSNGSVTLTVTGGVGPVTISWKNSGGTVVGTTSTVSGLPAGTYSYSYTDGVPTTFTGTVTVTQPGGALTVGLSTTDPTCSYLNNGTAVASIIANGTPGYTYAWSAAGEPDSPTATGLSPGPVSVTVTDANGCTGTASGTTTNKPPLNLTVSTIPDSCYQTNTGEASVAVTGGTPGYTYLWSNSNTSVGDTIYGVGHGSYTVTVTDHNSCTATAVASVSQPPQLTATISDSNVACFGGATGTATITPAGGNGGYTYIWSNSTTSSSTSGLTANTYYVTVTDAKNCKVIDTLTITQPVAPISVTDSQVNVKCKGSSTGSVTLIITGGSPAYTVNWAGGATGLSRTNLNAGNYAYTVTDAHNCTYTGSVTITEPLLPFTIGVVHTNVSCFGGNNGTITLTSSGGTLPYAIAPLWLDGFIGLTRTNLTAGTYYYADSDANGCIDTGRVVITQPSQLIADTLSTTAVSCFGGNNGSITLSVSGGTYPYIYAWTPAISITDSLGINLAAGTDTIYITDAQGCKDTLSFVIAQPAPLVPSIVQTDSTSCFGGSNGEVIVNASGGTSPYSYALDGSATYMAGGTFTGLSAGNHTVTVKDAHGCDSTISFTIYQPSQIVPAILYIRDASCNGSCNGSIAVTATGGTPSYTFSDNGSSYSAIDSFTSLCAGSYTVYLKDANGCIQTLVDSVRQPAALHLTVSNITGPSCFGGSNGQITVTATGGTPSYLYSIDLGQPQAAGIFTGLSAGLHIIGVGDSHICLDTIHILLGQPAPLVADTISTHSISCFGGNNGTITIGVSGGTYPYNYAWPQSPGITDSLGINLIAGPDTVYITDANGCKDTVTAILTQPTPQSPYIVSTDSVSCFGGNNGSVTVSDSGGVAPYTYAIDGSASYQSSGTFTGLSAGTHTITIKDAHLCDTSISFTIYHPTIIVPSITYTTNASCNGTCNGVISVSATGGIAPYTFSKDGVNYSSVDSFTALCAGNYTLYVKDANGCTQSITGVITQPAALGLSVSSITQPSCFGASNGQITVSATGGTPAYLYSIDFGLPQLTGTFSGLSAGMHVIGVGDSHLCLDTIHVLLGQPNPLVADTISTQPISCFGGNNGTITVGVSGGTYPYSYSWPQAPGITDSLGINLTAGTDTIYVTDANGCKDTVTAILSQPAKLAPFVVTLDSVSCFGGNNGGVTVNANGGTSPYSYALDGSSTYQISGTFSGLSAGSHTITVKDAHGCDSILPISIYQPTVLIPAITYTTNASCNGSCNGVIALSATGGTAPYSYSKDGTTYTSVDSFTALCQGNYTLYVKDAKGCIQTILDAITQPTVLTLALSDTIDPLCFAGTTGHIAVTAGGGTPTYTYTLDGGTAQSTDSFTNVSAGAHAVTVTDAHGCTQTVNLSLGQPTQVITDTVRTVQDTCYGSSNGAIYLTTSGGFGPYTYAWQNSAGNATDSATGLAAGTYTTTITDAHGCAETVSYTISAPAQPVLSILPGDTTIGFGDTIQLSTQFSPASLGTPSVYAWTADPSGTLSCLNCPAPYMTSNDSINTYTLQVTYNNNLCNAIATVTIKVEALDTFAVADAFTPNGDGKNDVYIIQAKEVKSFHMDIFDRWGQTVFSSDDITLGWDGTYKGKPQPEGMYTVFFSLQYGQNKSIQKTSGLMLFR